MQIRVRPTLVFLIYSVTTEVLRQWLISSENDLSASDLSPSVLLFTIGSRYASNDDTASASLGLLYLQNIGKVSHICTISVSYFFALIVEKSLWRGFSQLMRSWFS
jgi:hypothetical protein